jgi:hypothetical protein
MAKKPVVNKSQAVRDFLKAKPGTANKDVAEALNKQGVKLTPNYVAAVKGKMAERSGKRKRRGKAARAMSVKTGVGVAEIKAAFGLLKHCGSIGAAREALAAAQEIMKIL